MAYTIPSFNVLCNIDSPDLPGVFVPPTPPYRVPGQACALVYGRRVNTMSTGGTGTAGVPVQTMNLLLPRGADVRGPQDDVSADVVEVPAGSGRWYEVTFVDDIGRGWANEHRTAGLLALRGWWSAPYP